MKKIAILVMVLCFNFYFLKAQNIHIAIDTNVVTNHSATINGFKIPYVATTGMQPVWNEEGKIIAALNYTYYKKSEPEDMANRPLLISFNGGPGTASVWMQIGYTGPELLNIDPEGHPIQPYGVHNNPYSVLDIADLLYVNPVNTGYSRTIPLSGKDIKRDQFFGVGADIKYLAAWINTFITRYDRWLSPKFIIGESYGGTRVSGLALELQERYGLSLNGVILVSPADFNVINSNDPLSSALNLPYFAATAWYYKALPDKLQQKDLLEILPEVEEYSLKTLMPALAKGGFITGEEKQTVAEQIAVYSGLSVKSILQQNLNVPKSFFWKELLRDKTGYTIGRLDSRYMGIDKTEAGISPEYNAEMTSWLHAFTPAINYYIREQLNFKTDVEYYMFGPVFPWNFENDNTRDNLRKAMAENPYLRVMFQAGYYDGGIPYFSTKYSMWQIDPSGKLKDRLSYYGYRSGHMIYIRQEDLKLASDHLRTFIRETLADGKPRY